MRKIIFCLIAAFLFTGCAGWDLKPADEALIKSASRTLGFKVAQNNPTHKDAILAFCDGILVADDPTDLFMRGINLMLTKFPMFDDPLMRANVQDILALIKLDPRLGSELDIERLKMAVAAFKEGVELA